MRALWLLSLCSLAHTDGSESNSKPSIISLSDGKVRGLGNQFWRLYRGIPFARAPVDALRFMPPERQLPWAPKVLDATEFKPNCAQKHYASGPSWAGLNDTFSEDCLYLNVYTPPEGAQRPAGGWPVMHFIYGGDYSIGGADDAQINGQHTVRALGDVIVVVPNYRQTIFGMLGGTEVAALSRDGSTGTQGFLDQRAALAWTHANVEAFGGDASRVMLFGESSGASSVSAHLVAPASWPFFSRAGLQSGAFAMTPANSRATAQTLFDFWASAAPRAFPRPSSRRPSSPSSSLPSAAPRRRRTSPAATPTRRPSRTTAAARCGAPAAARTCPRTRGRASSACAPRRGSSSLSTAAMPRTSRASATRPLPPPPPTRAALRAGRAARWSACRR